ncbi:hypothetical protein QQ060_001486 [Listeria monocytogenes]|nr:hypothetical protein [Listeria monocytogenes]
MESYIQITNEAAAKMILNGDYKELWFKSDKDIVKCSLRIIRLEKLPELTFFVRLSDEK